MNDRFLSGILNRRYAPLNLGVAALTLTLALWHPVAWAALVLAGVAYVNIIVGILALHHGGE